MIKTINNYEGYNMLFCRSKRIAALVLCFVLLIPVLVSCSSEAGASAYDIAVKNGFKGTEQQWLDSLKGADGKDGENGEDGADGKDFSLTDASFEALYAAAVSQGYTGTAEEYKSEVLGISNADDLVRTVNSSALSAVSVLSYFNYRIQGSSYINTSKGGSAASGFIYKLDKELGDAYIITNYHAVYDSESKEKLSQEIYVRLYGLEQADMQIEAEFVGGTATYDIAVLKVTDSDILKNSNAVAVKTRSSSTVKLGESVFTIGNAKSMGLSSSVGVVSMDSMELEVDRADDNGKVVMRLLRTAAPLNHGNSGGALFDKNGNVIGVVVAKNIDDQVEGIGYIIPSDIALRAADNIIHSSEIYGVTNIRKCLLGITVTYEDPKTVIDPTTGAVHRKERVVVKEIVPASAAIGKVLVDDIIVSLSVRGETVMADRVHNIVDFMRGVRVGDTVTITLIRNGEEMTVDVTFTEASVSDIA